MTRLTHICRKPVEDLYDWAHDEKDREVLPESQSKQLADCPACFDNARQCFAVALRHGNLTLEAISGKSALLNRCADILRAKRLIDNGRHLPPFPASPFDF